MITKLVLYDNYIDFIIFVKFVFLLLAFTEYYYKHFSSLQTKEQTIKFIEYLKERVEFIFTFSMSILILILFRKSRVIVVEKHLMFLFIAYALINLISANWELIGF